MNPNRVLCWTLLLGLGALQACGGVSTIGSGDDAAHAGSSATSSGGSNPGMPTAGADATGTGAEGAEMGDPGPGMSTGGSSSGGGGPAMGTGAMPGVGASGGYGACATDMDCPAGDTPCEACADGSFACSKTFCAAGKCVTSPSSCAVKCMLDTDCPQPDVACTDCGDGTKACPTAQCLKGTCQTSYPGCGNIDPCKGQACGTECKSCGPDGNCDTTVLSYCNADGKCEPGLPQCGMQTLCKTSMDCGEPPPTCVPCANATCAGFECIEGSCVFACPANPTPECKLSEDCPVAMDVCKKCPSGSCAVPACLQGSCELVCPL